MIKLKGLRKNAGPREFIAIDEYYLQRNKELIQVGLGEGEYLLCIWFISDYLAKNAMQEYFENNKILEIKEEHILDFEIEPR